MKSILGQITMKEKSRIKRINEYVNKIKLIMDKSKSITENLTINPNFEPPNLQLSSSKFKFEACKNKNDSNYLYYATISNKINLENSEFVPAHQIYEDMNKNSPEIVLGEFNVKNKLYPDIANSPFKKRFKRILTRLKSTEKNEETMKSRKSKQQIDLTHKKTKSQVELYSSMNISSPIQILEIPFVNVRMTPQSPQQVLSAIPKMNSSLRVTTPQLFVKKAYFTKQSSKNWKSNSNVINTYMKKISTASSMEFSPGGNNNMSFMKIMEKEKKKLFREILKEKSFGFAKYAFPSTSEEFSNSQFLSLKHFL